MTQLKGVNGLFGIPINRADYELLRSTDMDPFGAHGSAVNFGVSYEYHATTQEEWQRYDDLVNSITKIELCDHTIFDIVEEVCDAYFAGDKTIDETVELVQRRVTLYVNESR